MKLRGLLVLFLVLFAGQILYQSSAAAAKKTETRTIYINGQAITTKVLMKDGHQLVPAALFRHANVWVGWNSDYRSAVLRNHHITLGLPIDKGFADYAYHDNEVWLRDDPTLAATIIEERSYVPLAYTASKLSLMVDYDADTKHTYLSVQPVNHYFKEQAEEVMYQYSDTVFTEQELYWLYQITEAEAGGESFEGKTAVAASILNRVKSSDWPDSIIDTIFQVTYDESGKAYYQYSPVLDKRIYSVIPSEDTMKAVHASLNGEDPSQGAVVFYNPDKTDNQWVRSRPETVVIGNHVFAK